MITLAVKAGIAFPVAAVYYLLQKRKIKHLLHRLTTSTPQSTIIVLPTISFS